MFLARQLGAWAYISAVLAVIVFTVVAEQSFAGTTRRAGAAAPAGNGTLPTPSFVVAARRRIVSERAARRLHRLQAKAAQQAAAQAAAAQAAAAQAAAAQAAAAPPPAIPTAPPPPPPAPAAQVATPSSGTS
jgi:hypothetical protein